MKGRLIGMHSTKCQSVNKVAVAFFLLSVLLYLSSCAHIGITYYDPTTYKNLTDLKPEVTALYDTFTNDTIDKDKISAIRLKLAQMYEYEKGKGEKNKETYEQIRIIQNMFERQVSDRLKNGKWNSAHASNQKQMISEAFDIAIETEAKKNKNE
jgi:hypothetical protein